MLDSARANKPERLSEADASSISLGVLQLLSTPAPSALAKKSSGFLGNSHVAPIMGDMTAIGRGLQNAVVLLDPGVSREHALLQRTVAGWRIQNVSIQQSLFVEDQPVLSSAYAPVNPGDTIRIGDSTMRLLTPVIVAEDTSPDTSIAAVSNTAGSNILNPGVTLQFALGGQNHPKLRWLVIGLATVGLLLSALATLQVATLAGKDALASGGFLHVLAALTIPLLPAIGVTLLIGLFDRYEREPWLTLLGAFIWGALIAIPPTLFFERTLSTLLLIPLNSLGRTGIGAILAYAGGQAAIAGITEEIIKGAGLLLLLLALRDEFDNVTDGILYGLLIGAGFAVVENFVYFAVSPNSELPFLVLARIVLGWLGHSTFTALFGAALGYAREKGTQPRRNAWLFPLVGLLAAILLHTFFDFVTLGTSMLADAHLLSLASPLLTFCTLLLSYGPLLAIQLWLLRLLLDALEREAETVRCYLADEVLAGTLLPDEYIVLQSASVRSAAERRVLSGFGIRAYLTARAFYQAATGLAFRKWHVALGDHPKNAPRQPEEVYRERIIHLRYSLYQQMER